MGVMDHWLHVGDRCVNCHHEHDAHMPDGRCLFGTASWEAPPPVPLPAFYEFSPVLTPADPAVPRDRLERQAVQSIKQKHTTRTAHVLKQRKFGR